jgi:hypothetical protein
MPPAIAGIALAPAAPAGPDLQNGPPAVRHRPDLEPGARAGRRWLPHSLARDLAAFLAAEPRSRQR